MGLRSAIAPASDSNFNKQPATRYLRGYTVANLGIRIPAGEEAHRENGSLTLRRDSLVYAVFPHMHLLGKEMRMVAKLPDGSIEPLLWLYEYKAVHKHAFLLRKPLTLPVGTVIRGVPKGASVILLPA